MCLLFLTKSRDPTVTETKLCMSISCGGTGQQWTAAGAGALGAADLGVAKALLEEVVINPTIELLSRRTYTGLGNRLLEGTDRTLCAPDPGERSRPHKRLNPDLPRSVQESPVEVWVGGGLLQGWGH